jgi:AcrR family transcriptional regulator
MIRQLNPERRARFLSSALKLFAANGVQNTSTADIARAAGAAAGTLFLYFPTKQDLVHELLLSAVRGLSDTINALLEPSLSSRQTFLAIWNGTIQWFMQNGAAYQYIQQVRDSGQIAESVVQESNKFFIYYYTAIQKGLQEDSIKPYPLELIGDFLYHDIVGTMNLVRAQPDPAKQQEYIRLGFELYWDGIKKTAATPAAE